MTKWRIMPALAGFVLLAACADSSSNERTVARAGDYTLTVDEAVALLVDEENLPNDAEVVNALAELWLDYTLLADAVARDSTLGQLELAPLVRQQLDQQMVLQLRDSVIQTDTTVSDDELREAYEREAPDARLHARHILLGFPPQATPAQRDSVRAEIEGLRQRIVSGESFAALARRYSQDPGTSANGGDLGTIERGDVVRPIEEAAFALSEGEISDVVESPYGLHIIRVDGKEIPGFDEVRDQYRRRFLTQRVLEAESTWVAGVEERRSPEVADDAINVVKELARDPGARLSRRAGRRPLVSYGGGAFTVGAAQRYMQTRQQQWRDQVASATDEQLDALVRGMGQNAMLATEAHEVGLEPAVERVDSLVDAFREQLLDVADEIGLRRLDRAPGEALAPAIERAVNQALQDVITGADNVVPLGAIGFQLRARTATTVYESGVGQALLEIGRIRASRTPAPAELAPDSSTSSDQTGN